MLNAFPQGLAECNTDDSIDGECEDCQSPQQSYYQKTHQYKPDMNQVHKYDAYVRGCVDKVRSYIEFRRRRGEELSKEIDRRLYPCYKDLQVLNIGSALDKYNQQIDQEIKRYETLRENVLNNTLEDKENMSLNSIEYNFTNLGIDKVMDTFGDIGIMVLRDDQLEYCRKNKIISGSSKYNVSYKCAEALRANRRKSCHKIHPTCAREFFNDCRNCKKDLEKKLSKITEVAPELKFLSENYELSEGETMSKPIPVHKDGKGELLIKGIDQHLAIREQRSEFGAIGGDDEGYN